MVADPLTKEQIERQRQLHAELDARWQGLVRMFDQERAHRLSIEAQLKKLRDAIDEAWITWGVEHAHATEADLDDVRLETIQEAKRLLDDADNKIQNLRDALEREKMGKGCF